MKKPKLVKVTLPKGKYPKRKARRWQRIMEKVISEEMAKPEHQATIIAAQDTALRKILNGY